MVDFEMKVVLNLFPAMGDALEKQLSKIVRKTAFDIERRAKSATPVDTGALRASIHVITDKQDGYGQAVAMAESKSPQSTFFAAVRPEQRLEAVVAVAAEYGIYVEMGTVLMPARPFFATAVEAIRPNFETAVERALLDAMILR